MNTNANESGTTDPRDARFEAWGWLCDAVAHVRIARRALRREIGTAGGVGSLLSRVERDLVAARNAVDDGGPAAPAARLDLARTARKRIDRAHAALTVLGDAAGSEARSEVLADAARVIGTALANVEHARAELDAWTATLTGAGSSERLAS